MHIFDSHFHIFDPRFPLAANAGFTPEPYTLGDYRAQTASLGTCGGALVASSFQGQGQDWLIDALARLGPGYVGVAQLPEDAPAAEIRRLDALGVRALRFNLHRGVHPSAQEMVRLARRAFDAAGWHAELYLDAAEIPRLSPIIDRLPAIVIDHLGLSRRGLPHLLDLVALGARVKATGFGRLDFPAGEALTAIARVDPNALVFGTDLPCTRTPRPFAASHIGLIQDGLKDADLVSAVLCENALRLYRLRP